MSEKNGKRGNAYAKFETNRELESEGRIIDYYDDEGKIAFSFRVARMGPANKRWLKKFDRLSKPHRRAAQVGALSPEKGREIMVKSLAGTVVLDWRNVEDRDGNPLPFSEENCIKLLTDLPDLYADLVEQAQTAELYKDEMRAIAEGNS